MKLHTSGEDYLKAIFIPLVFLSRALAMQSNSCARAVFSRKTAITFYTLLILGKKRHSRLAMPFLAPMLSQFTASFRRSFLMVGALYKFKFPLEQVACFLLRDIQSDREFTEHKGVDAP